MRILSSIIVGIAVLASVEAAADNGLFPRGSKAENVHHVGDVWLSHASNADDYYDYSIAVAEFAPGARLDWHLHPAGQQLIVVDGVGYYQERNAPGRVVRKGEVIKCTPGVEHWHAAAPDSGVTYIAISGNQPTQWLEPVSEEDYRSVQSDSPGN